MTNGKKDDKQEQNYTDWYAMWMQQSKVFFDTANENLQTLFSKSQPFDPAAHMEKIELWLEELKKQWQLNAFNMQQKTSGDYFQMMFKMMNDATDLMLKQWVKKVNEQDAIRNIHDLYALWLNCCHETYQQYMHTKTFQEAYGEFMNKMFKFWKSNIPG